MALEFAGHNILYQNRNVPVRDPDASVLMDWILENTDVVNRLQKHQRYPSTFNTGVSLSRDWERHLATAIGRITIPGSAAMLLKALEPWLPPLL